MQDGADEVVRSVTAKYPQAQFLVVDDLCDRLAQLLQERYPDRQRRVFVTHMVNPRGIDYVTFTNSYCDWRAVRPDLPENVSVIDIDKSWQYM